MNHLFSLRQLFLLSICLLLLTSNAMGIIFDRRDKPDPETSWYVYPIAGKIPGVQEFYGAGATISAIGGTGTDLTIVSLGGEAKHIDKGDFRINLITLLDLPLFTDFFTFSYYYTDITNGSWPEGQRGINSDPDSTFILLATKVFSAGAEIGMHLFEDQLELYYAYVEGDVTPYGVLDPEKNFYDAERADIIEQPRIVRWGVYLDDTDDRRDPRIGYRVQYEQWKLPASRGENAAFVQDDYNYTLFIPVLPNRQGVLVLNKFISTSEVTEPGVVDRDQYICPEGADDSCTSILDELYRRQVENSTNGKSTSLGGTNRLRGYRANRFFDSNSAFQGIEFRWYVIEAREAFNFLIEKGTFTGFQLAFFYEEGTVAPTKEELWDDKKISYGVGARFLLDSVIFRIDLADSGTDEGGQSSVFIGYPF